MRNWQSAKTPGGGSFGHPRQEECLCLTIHIATALHFCFQSSLVVVDSVCTDVNTTCTMIIHVRTAHHRCQAQSVGQDTERKHGKHSPFFSSFLSSFLFLSPFFIMFSTFSSFCVFLFFVFLFDFFSFFLFFLSFLFFLCFSSLFSTLHPLPSPPSCPLTPSPFFLVLPKV